MNHCGKCGTKLLSATIYATRKRIPTGLFCPYCFVQVTFSKELVKHRDIIIKDAKEKAKSKPKFLKKERDACPYCMDKGIVNRKNWTIRKMPKIKDKTQQWKCTCHRCGGVWQTNSGEQYHIIDPNQPKYTKGL